MSLDNIQITPDLLQALYKKSLVNLDGQQVKTDSLNENEWVFLGNNEKNILIIVNEKNSAFLADEDLSFLMGILTACSLSMADVALLNYFKNQDISYTGLMDKFSPDKILFFGVEPAALDFPLQFPNYQLQKYNHQTYLSSPSLTILAKDIPQKQQLWSCLKTLFPVT